MPPVDNKHLNESPRKTQQNGKKQDSLLYDWPCRLKRKIIPRIEHKIDFRMELNNKFLAETTRRMQIFICRTLFSLSINIFYSISVIGPECVIATETFLQFKVS